VLYVSTCTEKSSGTGKKVLESNTVYNKQCDRNLNNAVFKYILLQFGTTALT